MGARRPFDILHVLLAGETQWKSEGRLHGSTDLPLSESGRASVMHDAGRFAGRRLTLVHHPPDEAATESAKLLAEETGARTRSIDDLADPHMGLLEGLRETEFGERHPKRRKQWAEEPLGLVPPDGEPIVDARARIFRAIAKIMKKSRAGETAIVLHPIGLGLLRCWLADRPASEMHGLIDARPRIERYLLTPATVEALRDVEAAETADA